MKSGRDVQVVVGVVRCCFFFFFTSQFLIVEGSSVCYSCLSIRLGRPLVVRGPAADELDTTFPVLKLLTGFRGFSSNGEVFALDGADPWSMGGPRTLVIPHRTINGVPTNFWLNSVFHYNSTQCFGIIHQETHFNYSIGQTYKKMDVAYSPDEGLSWSEPVVVIAGNYLPTPGETVGEGDCSAVLSSDNSTYYLYCMRAPPSSAPDHAWTTIAARAAAASNLADPSSWKKLYKGEWQEPGIGGQADSLGFLGTTSAYFESLNEVALFGIGGRGTKGITLSFSSDYKNFNTLAEPILCFDEAQWIRPQPTDLYAYVGAINYEKGGNRLPNTFGLNYVYLPPGGTFEDRYLVFQDLALTIHPSPLAYPQVGVELTRWKAQNGILRTTNAPVIGNYVKYDYLKSLGYLLTKPPSLPSTKLEECWSDWPGHDDFLVTLDGTCTAAGYTRLRTLGWVFQESSLSFPPLQPLYRCYDPLNKFHFVSNDETCEEQGKLEFLLGYLFNQ